MAKEITIDGIVYVPRSSVVQERTGAWTVGTNYLIRTVTMTLTGMLSYIDEHELVLENASWVADTGRFADALKTGKLNEVEPFPSYAIIGRGSIVDATEWIHELPRTQK